MVELRQNFRLTLEAELDRVIRPLRLDETQMAAIQRGLAAGVEKILHGPTEHLREWAKDGEFGDWHTDLLLVAIRSLFDLNQSDTAKLDTEQANTKENG